MDGIKSYTINKVTKRTYDYVLEYAPNYSCSVNNYELEGFVPKAGMKLMLELKNDDIVGMRFNGRKIR